MFLRAVSQVIHAVFPKQLEVCFPEIQGPDLLFTSPIFLRVLNSTRVWSRCSSHSPISNYLVISSAVVSTEFGNTSPLVAFFMVPGPGSFPELTGGVFWVVCSCVSFAAYIWVVEIPCQDESLRMCCCL